MAKEIFSQVYFLFANIFNLELFIVYNGVIYQFWRYFSSLYLLMVQCFTLNVQMDSSFLFDAIILGWSIIYRGVIIFK